MAPRNNDPNTSYKKSYPVESIEIQDMVPCILHKKHKVVKLVKSHIRKIRQEGLLCAISPTEPDESSVDFRRAAMLEENRQRDGYDTPEGRQSRLSSRDSPARHDRRGSRMPSGDPSGSEVVMISRRVSPYFLLFLLEILLLIFLMVYISAGPLSNSIAHTPIPPGSFVRTERPCHLEKKYLLRWSRPEYLE